MLFHIWHILTEQESGTSGGGGANAAELKSLQAENERLKTVIAKQEYRIRHLITGFEELLASKQK